MVVVLPESATWGTLMDLGSVNFAPVAFPAALERGAASAVPDLPLSELPPPHPGRAAIREHANRSDSDRCVNGRDARMYMCRMNLKYYQLPTEKQTERVYRTIPA